MQVAMQALPLYAHKYAPKTFTEHQLFICLVLKRFFKTSYRGIQAILIDMPALCADIRLKKVPHFTTLQQAESRLLNAPRSRQLLLASNELFDATHQPRGNGRRTAADGTGMQAGHRSSYYTKRRRQSGERVPYRRFPKATMLGDIDTHMVLSMHLGYGPKPDVSEFCYLLDDVQSNVPIHHVYADAGFDSEFNHRYARQMHGILTTIPATAGRHSGKPPTGKYRRQMRQTFGLRKQDYHQRWQIETINSMIKRNQGDTINAQSYWPQMREMALAVLTHNIAILMIRKVPYRAFLTPFLLFLLSGSVSPHFTLPDVALRN